MLRIARALLLVWKLPTVCWFFVIVAIHISSENFQSADKKKEGTLTFLMEVFAELKRLLVTVRSTSFGIYHVLKSLTSACIETMSEVKMLHDALNEA